MSGYAHISARVLFCVLAAWLGTTAHVNAQATGGGSNQRVTRAGDVDVASSRVYVHVDKSGLLGHEHAVEGKLSSGAIQFGAARNAGRLVFDMKSFAADTTMARRYIRLEGNTDASTRKKVNENMLGSAVLNTRRYPTATFAIESALPLQKKSKRGNPLYQLAGKFTLHGRTKPLRIVAETVNQRGTTLVLGSFRIKQSDYGITPFSKALGAIGVADKLSIHGVIRVAGQVGVAQGSASTRR